MYNAAETRREMASEVKALAIFDSEDVHLPSVGVKQEADMEVVEL